jgi:CelD/BcsL family acetyltransferase involved in cellulose biosynthesis
MLAESTRAVNVLNKSGVGLYQGEAAWQQLSNMSFLAEWDKLYEDCPWATVFQSRAFVTTWYETYRHEYLPLFIVSFEANKLAGLLLLAKSKYGTILGAGENQAEYQVWLATAGNGNKFITKALIAVNKHFPTNNVQLKYIPGNAPMQWIGESAELKRRCLVKVFKQPLLKIEAAHFITELQKKNRREKLNRLKRLGELQFERITDRSTLAAILDELALQCDFRKRAVFNTAVFQNDPKRKRFLLSLFDQGLLHATVLKVNEEIIASNIGAAGKNWVHLQGVNTHAPTYAKYSPGILHLLMLGKQLASEGISVFDLTPGGDPYKDQLATNYTEAFHLSVCSPYHCLTSKIKLAAGEQLKKLVQLLGGTPSKAKWQTRKIKEKYKHILKQGFSFSINYLISKIGASKKESVYVLQKDLLITQLGGLEINKNSLFDLLCFDPKGSSENAWTFFEEAMRRFEAGERSYTYCEDGRLLVCAWLNSTKSLATVKTPSLQGFYCHSNVQGRQKKYVAAIAAAAICDQAHHELFAVAYGRDKSICRTLEAIGFKMSNCVRNDDANKVNRS